MHAVTMASCASGWTWALIDADGGTAATGEASLQEDAWDAAHRAAHRLQLAAGDNSTPSNPFQSSGAIS